MSGTLKTFGDIVEDFNLSSRTEFNKQYQEYEPALQNFAFKYNTGAVSDSKFFINMLFGSARPWKGTQAYNKINKMIEQIVVNKDYFIDGIEIPNRDFKRAQQANSVTGLDMYTKGIGNFASIAKDAPIERMLELLEAGTGTTEGTCFDNQPLFSPSHAFDNVSGTQSNLLTGTGTLTSQIAADIKSAMSAMKGYYYSVDTGDNGNVKKRPLNKNGMKLTVLCDPSLWATMNDVRDLEMIVNDLDSGAQNNTLRNTFEVVTRHFADPSDYYVIDTSDASTKPFLIPMEDEGTLITPQDNQEALANLQVLRYAYNQLSFGNGYGAWWKIAKINN